MTEKGSKHLYGQITLPFDHGRAKLQHPTTISGTFVTRGYAAFGLRTIGGSSSRLGMPTKRDPLIELESIKPRAKRELYIVLQATTVIISRAGILIFLYLNC